MILTKKKEVNLLSSPLCLSYGKMSVLVSLTLSPTTGTDPNTTHRHWLPRIHAVDTITEPLCHLVSTFFSCTLSSNFCLSYCVGECVCVCYLYNPNLKPTLTNPEKTSSSSPSESESVSITIPSSFLLSLCVWGMKGEFEIIKRKGDVCLNTPLVFAVIVEFSPPKETTPHRDLVSFVVAHRIHSIFLKTCFAKTSSTILSVWLDN